MLVRHCTADALKRHERVNAFNLVCTCFPSSCCQLNVFDHDIISVHSTGTVITRVCWLVRLFVRYARYDFSKTTSAMFMKVGADV